MKMKRILSFVLCLCIMLSVCPLSALAYYKTKTEGDFEYSPDTHYGVAVVRYKGTETDVTVPQTLGGKPVNAIEDYAFADNESLVSVSLPESVKIIGQYSFAYCYELKSINLENIEHIGNYAFSSCAVKEANLSSLKKAYPLAFCYCSKLKAVTLPKSLKKIERGLFYYCTGLENINLENIKTVGAFAFVKDKSLKSVNLKNAETIETQAFEKCSSLESITLNGNIKSIKKDAFYQTALYKKAVSENKSAFYLGEYLINAFTDRTKGEFKIKNGTALIADNAFENADGNKKATVTGVYIPDGVTSIGEKAIYNGKIKKIRFPKTLERIAANALSQSYIKKNSVSKDGCTYIKSYLIGCDKYALNIKIKKGTTIIADNALFGSIADKLVIPEGVKYIGDCAITGCQRIRYVKIPKSVKKIGENNFVNYSHLTECTCKNLQKITVNKNNKKYSSKDGVLYNKNKTVLIAYPAGSKNKSFKLPSSVKTIKNNAFAFAPYLSEVKFNSKLVTIGDTVFTNCPKFKSVTVPESVKNIGFCAFGYRYWSDDNVGGYHNESSFTVYGKKGSAAEEYCNRIVYILDYEDESDYTASPITFKEV